MRRRGAGGGEAAGGGGGGEGGGGGGGRGEGRGGRAGGGAGAAGGGGRRFADEEPLTPVPSPVPSRRLIRLPHGLGATQEEADALRAYAGPYALAVRCFGLLSLPTHGFIARRFDDLAVQHGKGLLGQVEGAYRNGAKIVRLADDALRVYRPDQGQWIAWAEGYETANGLLFAFDGRDNVFDATFDGGVLRFSNATHWAKA